MGNANEWELALLLVDRWDTLPDWGGCWQAAHWWDSSLVLVVMLAKSRLLVIFSSSSSLLEYVLLGSIASVVDDTIEFAEPASFLGAYKLSKVKIVSFFWERTPKIYLQFLHIHNISIHEGEIALQLRIFKTIQPCLHLIFGEKGDVNVITMHNHNQFIATTPICTK